MGAGRPAAPLHPFQTALTPPGLETLVLLFGTCLSVCVTEETRETGRENGGTGRDREGDRGRRARIKGRSLSPLSHPPASPQMRGSPRSHACHTCHPHRTMVLARGWKN